MNEHRWGLVGGGAVGGGGGGGGVNTFVPTRREREREKTRSECAMTD